MTETEYLIVGFQNFGCKITAQIAHNNIKVTISPKTKIFQIFMKNITV